MSGAEVYYKSMNRRDFIKTGLAAVGALVTVGIDGSFGLSKNEKEATRWAFLVIISCAKT